MNKKDDLGFLFIKFFFVTKVQEFDCNHCFLEVSLKGLGKHDLRFLFSTMHIMEKTVISSNGASSGSNFIKEGVADPEEGVGLVCSIVIFKIL